MECKKRERHSLDRGMAVLLGGSDPAILYSDAAYRLKANGVMTENGLTCSVDANEYAEKYRYMDIQSAISVLHERTPLRFERVGDRLYITDVCCVDEGGVEE